MRLIDAAANRYFRTIPTNNMKNNLSKPEASSVFIYVTGDFTLGKNGSHIRFAQMIDYCLGIFSKVTVYSYSNNFESPWLEDGVMRFNQRFPGATLVLDVQTPALKRLFRLKNLALMVAPSRVASILRWRMNGHAPELRRLMMHNPAPAILVNSLDGLSELNGIDVSCAHVDTHNSKFIRYAKVRGRKLWEWKSLARFRTGVAVLGAAKSVISVSQIEAGFLRLMFGDRLVHLVPSYIKPHIARDSTNVQKSTDLLFVGSNNVYNREGLKTFIRSNDAVLRACTLTVAGSVCSDTELQSLAGALSNVRLLGWVDDLAELYRRAALVIAPVDGTGLNMKVVQALEHGKPVLASERARQALPPGHSNCVFPIKANIIESLLQNPQHLADAEDAAVEFAHGPQMRGDLPSLTRLLRT